MAKHYKNYDLAIIGGGIIGTATALTFSKIQGIKLAVIESENRLAFHQSGHNSGVIHSGIYYKPDTLKAQLCIEGREAIYAFCKEHMIPHQRCGKIIVATRESELAYLDTLRERGQANGITDIVKLDPAGIKGHEPYATGIAGLYVPPTGIVDYIAVVEKYAELIRRQGGEILLNSRIININRNADIIALRTPAGQICTKYLINCAGLYSDRIARMAGLKPGLQIIPFRGEYYNIRPARHELVKNLIYPVPDPGFPFLGVHFTRRIDGNIEAGPNAVLALRRDAYRKTDFSLLEMINLAASPGFWKMASKYWKIGLGEMRRSFDKSALVRELQRLLPDLKEDDIAEGGSGIRAQAMESDGSLVDDFRIVEAENMIHVLNAPSPAATASIKIGEYIAALARQNFRL